MHNIQKEVIFIKRTKKIFKRIFYAFLAVFLVGLLCAVTVSGALFMYMKNIDAELDVQTLAGGLGLTTKIYYTSPEGEELELLRLHGKENRIWVESENISPNIKNAFIAIEDHRFYEHCGIDVKRLAGAVLNFFSGKSYGGSTITQQLIKNLTGENQVTVKRKLTEIVRSIELEKNTSKDDILEMYLNNVYLSSGCFGVETAAEKFFGKSASEVSLAEAASLAAIVQNPSYYDPFKKPENNIERRNTVLFRMNELGFISDAEYDSAVAEELVTAEQKEISDTEEIYSWFTDALIEDVISDLMELHGISREQASAKVYSGGLTIRSTLDKDMQDMIEAFYAKASNFPKNEEGIPDSAAVIIDGRTGAVRAVAGGRGKKSSNRAFCLATKARRSPGSSLKPISVYAPAIEKNLVTWATVFDDVPVDITKSGENYVLWPKNNPRIYSGLTTVSKAVTNSVNTVAVRVLEKVGLRNSFDFCKKAGISGLVESAAGEGGQTLSDIAEAPLALGATSLGVTVRDMAGAYTMFTRGGEFEKTYTYTAVYDKDGTLLLSHGEKAERLISEETAYIMTRMLKDVVTKGTAKGLELAGHVEVAGKTGTSNSGADRWFIGCTPDYVCGVWVGYKDGRDIGEYKKNPACTVFDGIMDKVYDSLPEYTKKFSSCDGVVNCAFCADSGELASKACHCDPRGNRIETGYFKRGTEPKNHCDTHILVSYDKTTRAVACDKCPSENIIKTALLKVARSFPCEIKITDSQYTYRYLPIGEEPALEENMPFFANLRKKGEYFGTSGKDKAYNRYCREHFSETEATTEITTETTDKTTTSQMTTARTTTAQTTNTQSTAVPSTTSRTSSANTTTPQTVPSTTQNSRPQTSDTSTVPDQTTTYFPDE